MIATCKRKWVTIKWGSVPTDSSDPVLQLRLLCMRPTGWRDSVVRQSLPRELVEFLDGEGGADLGRDLRVLRDASAQHGWEAAVRGMEAALRATGGVDGASVELSAAVAASGVLLHLEVDHPVTDI